MEADTHQTQIFAESTPKAGIIPLLFRYIMREISAPFLGTLVIFTGLLFLAKSLKLLELVVSREVGLGEIAKIFLLIVPQFLEIALPMALLLGLILAFGRLSGDSELVVMRASGVSLRELVKPVVIFAAFVTALSLWVSISVRPWANTELAVRLFQMAKQRLSSGLVSGVFNQLGALTIYAEKVDENGGKLSNVVISDRRGADEQQLFLAKYGQIFSNEATRTLNLRLYDGSIHEGRGANLNITSFDSNSVVISESELLQDEAEREGKKASGMSFSELQEQIAELKTKKADTAARDPKLDISLARLLVEWHRRFSLPLSCLAVGLIGMVLGIQPSRGGKSWGMALNITVGILVITLYYFALAFATALGEQAVLPAWFIMWMPNGVFVFLAYYLYNKMESEQWLAVSQAIVEFLDRVSKKFKRRSA